VNVKNIGIVERVFEELVAEKSFAHTVSLLKSREMKHRQQRGKSFKSES
jgi:hypothetical protein